MMYDVVILFVKDCWDVGNMCWDREFKWEFVLEGWEYVVRNWF